MSKDETIQIYDIVELTCDIPKGPFPKGKKGTVVYIYPDQESYEVEFRIEGEENRVETIWKDEIKKT